MTDLEEARELVKGLIEDALMSFASENRHVTWCTFALYACPWAGWITANFDTEAISAQNLAAFSAEGPGWYGEDEWGRFNDNCPDFAFCEWRILELQDWRTEYERLGPLRLRDGSQDYAIRSDEALNGLVFRFLREILLDQLGAMKGRAFFPKEQHRFGIQLLDSQFTEFWRDLDTVRRHPAT